MDRFRRIFNRNLGANPDRESSSTAPTHQVDHQAASPQAAPSCESLSFEFSQLALTHDSGPPTESWTTHDSNLELLKCLSTATPTRPAIPTEIILQILEHPSRWVPIHSVYHPPSPRSDRPILYTSDKPTGNPVLYTRSLSARDIKLLGRVTFTFRSRDQGWCSNPDQGAWSWFEASLGRTSGDEEGQTPLSDAIVTTSHYHWIHSWLQRNSEELAKQPRYKIQSNRIGEIEPESYNIELADDHELVRRVREGDRIILWACACFAGWNNQVYEAQISIEGVDELRMEKIAGPSVTNNEGQEGHRIEPGLF